MANEVQQITNTNIANSGDKTCGEDKLCNTAMLLLHFQNNHKNIDTI